MRFCLPTSSNHPGKIHDHAFSYFCRVKALKNSYFIAYLLLLLGCSALLLSTQKLDLQLQINQINTPWLDYIMPFLTFLGDGLFAIILSLFFVLWINRKWGWMLLLTYGVSSLLAQIGKHLLFPKAMRPYFYLKTNSSFHEIPGFIYHEFHSFPSGHSTTAFALATLLSLCIKTHRIQHLALLLGACLVAFSRLYLSQHFLVDVVFGSLLGTLCSLFLFYYFPSRWLTIETPYLRR